MEKDELPKYADITPPAWQQGPPRPKRIFRLMALGFVSYMAYSAYVLCSNTAKAPSTLSIDRLQEEYSMCSKLRHVPEDATGLRDINARFVNGTKPYLIRNATVWAPTGDAAFEWQAADVFVEYGLIQRVEAGISAQDLPAGCEIFDAHGRPLTTGIIDMHSHAGEGAIASLAMDGNELSNDITPYVKSIDAIDPLQPEFDWIKSGGVTTTLILPGSGNNMGGEAFVMKTAVGTKSGRAELSQQDMLADPDQTWRYMKMACGENAKRVYGRVGERGPFSRMGEAWEFRHAFEEASAMVRAQDDWCAAADVNGVENMQSYLPQDLHWESLGAVLRGQIRVNTHCYTIPDLEMYVRLTNEFKFQVRAFHHAHQTYLLPEVLKRAWGEAPASALFADNMYYKVESYTASEQAGKILHDNGLVPVYVSDNPVLNSQHVVMEAAKAFRNGLPYSIALQGVTSQPARLLGLGHRIGKIAPGFDADILVWDSDPLSVGAAPVQVWIDGAPQFANPVVLDKPYAKLLVQESPVLEYYAKQEPASTNDEDITVFTGITHVNLPSHTLSVSSSEPATMVLHNGTITCLGECVIPADTQAIHVKDGHVTPSFIAFGSMLGLGEIDGEVKTQDGFNPESWSRAIDGLQLGGKQLAAAYAKGVTRAITPPMSGRGTYKGISALFSTGALNALDPGAVFATDVAAHISLTQTKYGAKTESHSAAIGELRNSLLSAIHANATTSDSHPEDAYTYSHALAAVVNGTLPLVLQVHSADAIAALLSLKSEVESHSPLGSKLRMIIHGGAETHIVAPALAEAGVPVVLAPLLAYQQSWDQRRALTGAPLTNGTAVDALIAAGVLVGIGPNEAWEARDLPLMAGVALANGQGALNYEQALNLVGANLYTMLGVESKSDEGEFVVFEGSPLEIDGRVRAVRNAAGRVDLWA